MGERPLDVRDQTANKRKRDLCRALTFAAAILVSHTAVASVIPQNPTTADAIVYTFFHPCGCCTGAPTASVNGNQVTITIPPAPPGGAGCPPETAIARVTIGQLPAGEYTVAVIFGPGPPILTDAFVVSPAPVPLAWPVLIGLALALAGAGSTLSRHS